VKALIAAIVLLMLPSNVKAAPLTLSIVPLSQTVTGPNQTVTVNLTISGLTRPPAIGAFDLDLTYLPSVLTPTAVTFGPFLGNEGFGEVLNSFTFPPGIVDLAAVSLLTDTELNTLQPPGFLLATVSFQAVAAGTTPLSFSQVIVDDAFANKLVTETTPGTVTVVPEPASLWLVSLVVSAMARARRGHVG
jgi:hypothetical protein